MFKYFPTFRNVARFFRSNVTKPGRTLLFLLFFTSIGLIYLESPLVFLFSAILSVLLISGFVSLLFRPQIECNVTTPEVVQAGKEFTADIFIRNLRNRTAFELFVEPTSAEENLDWGGGPELLPQLAPRRTARLRHACRFAERGVFSLPPLGVGSSFPFNLFRFRQTFQPKDRIVVTPSFKPLEHFEFPSSSFTADFEDELIQLAHAAGTSEYIGNREYHTGMPVRRWDFSSWARTGKPVVREYCDNQRGNAVLFLDGFYDADSAKSRQSFEMLLSLTTAVAFELSRQLIDVSALVISDTIYPLPATSPEDQVRNIGVLLAEATLETEVKLNSIFREEFIKMATLESSVSVMIWNSEDDDRRELTDRFRQESRMLCSIVVSQDGRAEGESMGVSFAQVGKGGVVIQ